MTCADVRLGLIKQIKESSDKNSIVFVVGQPGSKHGHLINHIMNTSNSSKVIELPLWADVDPVPTLLDFENRIVSYSRRVMKNTIRSHVRETLKLKNPTLDLPGAILFLTDESSSITLSKAKGWEHLLNLLDDSDKSTLLSELLQSFAETIREFTLSCNAYPVTLAINVRGPLDSNVTNFTSNISNKIGYPVIVAADEAEIEPHGYPVLRIPLMTRDESNRLLRTLEVNPTNYDVVWNMTKGSALSTLLISKYLAGNENADFSYFENEYHAFWHSLKPIQQKILSLLIVSKIDIDAQELAALLEISKIKLESELEYLTSSGLIDELQLTPNSIRTYVVDTSAAVKIAAQIAPEMLIKYSELIGRKTITRIIQDPNANPITTVRNASYFETLRDYTTYQEAILRTAPILLMWGATKNLRENIHHVNQMKTDSGFYLQYIEALLDLEDKDYIGAQRKLHKALIETETSKMGTFTSLVAKHWLSRTYERMGKFDEALIIMDGVISLLRQDSELKEQFLGLLAVSLSNKGLLLNKIGRLNEALDIFQESLNIDRKTKNLLGQAQDLRSSAFILQDTKRFEESLKFHQAALDLDSKISNVAGQAIDHANIGAMLLALGRNNEASRQLLLAKVLFERLNVRTEILKIENMLSTIENGSDNDK